MEIINSVLYWSGATVLCGLKTIGLCGLEAINSVLFILASINAIFNNSLFRGLVAMNSILLRFMNYNHLLEIPYTMELPKINPDDGIEEKITKDGHISYVLVLFILAVLIPVIDRALRHFFYVTMFLLFVLVPALRYFVGVLYQSPSRSPLLFLS